MDCEFAQDVPARARCAACTSLPTAYPGQLSNDHVQRTSYVSSQWPYRRHVYDMVAQAALRSLSCEVTGTALSLVCVVTCVRADNNSPLFFGDTESGFAVARPFQLDDYKARGFRNMCVSLFRIHFMSLRFSLVIVSTDKLLLLNSFDFLANAINVIVGRLQSAAKDAFTRDERANASGLRAGDSARAHMLPKEFLRDSQREHAASVPASAPERQPRPLSALTAQPDVFSRLHRYVFHNVLRIHVTGISCGF